MLLVFGFAMIALGSWIDTGLTHDWIGEDFMVSQPIEAIGLAFAVTALITFGVANITPPQAAAIAATIQIARLLGNEIGSAAIQTFVRVREQVYSYLIGLHLVAGLPATEQATAQLAGPFGSRATGACDPAARSSILNQKFLSTLGLDGDCAVTKPFDGGQDVVGGFGPAKGLGVGIAGVDVGGDGGLRRGSRAVGAALDLLVGEQGEEALDLVDP